MELVPKLCKLMMSGTHLSSKQQEAIKLFMILPENAQFILRAANHDSSILLCFRAFTREARRNGSYFEPHLDKDKAKKMIWMMLQILGSFPSYATTQENNAYFCLQGELLAALIDFEESREPIAEFFTSHIWMKEECNEMKIVCVLKIISSCFDEIIQLRKNQSERWQLRTKIRNFIMMYGFVFAPLITMVSEELHRTFEDFTRIYEVITSLQQAQDSFLYVMGQGQPIEVLAEEYQPKPYIMVWEAVHLLQWVKSYCIYLSKAFKYVVLKKQQISNCEKDKIYTLLCRCVTLSTYIYQMSINNDNEVEHKKLKFGIQCLLINNFLVPFLCNFTQGAQSSPIFKLTPEFHLAVLKLLLSPSELFAKIVAIQPFYEKIEQTNLIKAIKGYCQFVIANTYFYLSEFQECPIGQSIKLMNKLKTVSIDLLSRNLNNSQQVALQYENEINKMHEIFFQNFIIFKLLFNADILDEKEEVYTNGKNWEEFINTTLNYYFNDLIKQAPRIFSSPLIINEKFEIALPPDEDLAQEYQNFEMQKMLSQEDGKFDQETQRQTQFIANHGYRVLTRMMEALTFKQLLEFDDEPQDEQDSGRKQSSVVFAQVLLVMACFKALINVCANNQMRADLYMKFYAIHHEIEISEFRKDGRLKARICKMFLAQSYLEECIPDRFAQEGECASSTLLYANMYVGYNMDELILQITDCVAACLEKLRPQEQDDVQVTKYGLFILETLTRKLASRIYHVIDYEPEIKNKIKDEYSLKINVIFDTIMQFEIDTPACFESLYKVAGLMVDLCGIHTFYDIYIKLVNNTIDCVQEDPQALITNKKNINFVKLDLYLAGSAGLLASISNSFIFRIVAQIILEDLVQMKEKGRFNFDTDEQIQYLLRLANSVISPKLLTQVHDRVVLIANHLFNDIMAKRLEDSLEVPNQSAYAEQLYVNMTKLEIPTSLIPLPIKSQLHQYPQILNQYFNNITRVQNLSSLQPYASLKSDWMISFLEAKIERDQPVFIDLNSLFLNLRFQKSLRIDKLISMLSIVTKMPANVLLTQMRNNFKVTDHIFSKFLKKRECGGQTDEQKKQKQLQKLKQLQEQQKTQKIQQIQKS